MKKIIYILLIVVFVSGCSNEYKGWKDIHIPNVGALKIPQDWVYTENKDIVYFSDKEMSSSSECNIYLIGIVCNQDQTESLYENIDKDMEYTALVSSETLSNSAIIGENEYLIAGKTRRKFFLDLYSSNKQLYIIVLDDSIGYEIIKKIGNSYYMNVE